MRVVEKKEIKYNKTDQNIIPETETCNLWDMTAFMKTNQLFAVVPIRILIEINLIGTTVVWIASSFTCMRFKDKFQIDKQV